MSGRQLMVLIRGELWTIGRNPETSAIHGALENRVQDLALEILQLSEIDYKLRR